MDFWWLRAPEQVEAVKAWEEEDLRELGGVALERKLLEEDRYGGQIWSSKVRCVDPAGLGVMIPVFGPVGVHGGTLWGGQRERRVGGWRKV